MFMALAMQPQLAQVSYAGADGGAFAYYRDEGGKVRALFTDSHNRWKWNTQPVDPATGGLVGTAAAAAAASGGLYLPKAAWSLLSSKNASRASLGAGWARPGVRMLFFSAPAGDAGVVSAAVAVDDLLGAAASRVAHLDDYLDVYYAVSDTRGAPATAAYKPLLLGHRPGRSGDDEEGRMRTFSKARCAAAAIDAPRLGRLVAAGHGLYNKYRVACANFDVSGVQLVRAHALLYTYASSFFGNVRTWQVSSTDPRANHQILLIFSFIALMEFFSPFLNVLIRYACITSSCHTFHFFSFHKKKRKLKQLRRPDMHASFSS
jgi:hypothetical protein